jgi:hypothetical protein
MTRVQWTYRDKTYGMECKPSDIGGLLNEVQKEVIATDPGEIRDDVIMRIINKISRDPSNKNSWIPLGLTMLWFACSEDLKDPDGFGRHALRRAKEGASICFTFDKVNDTQWEVAVFCHPLRRQGAREPGVRLTVHCKPENAVHH